MDLIKKGIKSLEKGDQILILSTARKISPEEVQPAIDLLEELGYVIKKGRNLHLECNQFSGSIKERIEDLQSALDDPNCKAIFCARGGYGTVQLIDHLDFSKFQQNPKWVIGYSDVTVLHNHINQNFGVPTLHATMPINMKGRELHGRAVKSLVHAIEGKGLSYSFPSEEESNINGDIELTAPIVGGNLSIIYSLTGTKSQIDTRDKILFIEDLDEYLYHIDRMMMNLKRAGILKNLKALLVGGMSDMNDNEIPFGESAKEIIRRNVEEYAYPVIFGFPAGHIDNNLAIITNSPMTIKGNNKNIICSQDGLSQ